MRRAWIWLLWKTPKYRALREIAAIFGYTPKPGTEHPEDFHARVTHSLRGRP